MSYNEILNDFSIFIECVRCSVSLSKYHKPVMFKVINVKYM